MMTPPRIIDASNRGDHFHLRDADECYYFHDYTPRQGARYSNGNQLIYNLKKSVLRRGEPDYRYKLQAIGVSANMLKAAFNRSSWVFDQATFCPIPPSKLPVHPEYDNRMTQIINLACAGTRADIRELILQSEGYDASHRQVDGARIKPPQLEAMYTLDPNPPKDVVILVDDVLTTGAHFVAAKNVILTKYPQVRVVGFFIARRVVPNPFDEL